MLKSYFQLTKPGMVVGNLLPAIGAFLLADGLQVDWGLLVATIGGLALVIAGACAFNNYLDRSIDARMKRTSKRALVRGQIKPLPALIFANLLFLVGAVVLFFATNGYAFTAALIGYFGYVFIYGYAKRRSHWGTLVGSIPGAMPPVVGYTAVSGRLDGAVVILFFILAIWQMTHFYAIAVYRRSDYAAAGLPVLSVRCGLKRTKLEMLVYAALFIVIAPLLWFYGYAGFVYLLAVVGLGLRWLLLCLRGFSKVDDNNWGRQVFGFSLLLLLVFSAIISLNAWLP